MFFKQWRTERRLRQRLAELEAKRTTLEGYREQKRCDMTEQDKVTDYCSRAEVGAAVAKAHARGIYPMMGLPEVLVAVTVTPFVTAVASQLGTDLGGRIREALPPLLSRIPRPAILRRGTSPQSPSSLSVTSENGSRIEISDWTPVAALTALPQIDFSGLDGLGDVPATVRWISDRWHAVTIKDGMIVDASWDPRSREWNTHPSFGP
ncbi:hypothetical protein ABZ726_25495 [Streptomyces hundungensis]|uniref:hypothetical protein n=1 Tax=Streptomyces hundungensis TaxID=1077946 RepID=UPI0033F1D652